MMCRFVARRLIVAGAVLQRHESTESPQTNQVVQTDDSGETSVFGNYTEKVNSMVTELRSGVSSLTPPVIDSDTYKDMKREMDTQLTGWDLIKSLFTVGSDGVIHQNMYACIYTTQIGFACGFFYGGLSAYVKAYKNFIENNDVTNFASMQDARNQLGRKCSSAFFKGGCAKGPKVAILIALFMLTSTGIATYRGFDGILEYTIAGGVTAGMMRWYLGIRGILGGFISGGLTGFILGSLLYSGLKLFGTSSTDIKYYMYGNRKIDTK